MRKIYLALFILVCITGCVTATGPSFKYVSNDDPEKSTLYVYRMNKFSGTALVPLFTVNNSGCHDLAGGSYYRFSVDPGVTIIATKTGKRPGEDYSWPPASIGINALAGETYFVRFDIKWVSYGPYSNKYPHKYNEVSADQALIEIKNTKQQAEKNICD